MLALRLQESGLTVLGAACICQHAARRQEIWPEREVAQRKMQAFITDSDYRAASGMETRLRMGHATSLLEDQTKPMAWPSLASRRTFLQSG